MDQPDEQTETLHPRFYNQLRAAIRTHIVPLSKDLEALSTEGPLVNLARYFQRVAEGQPEDLEKLRSLKRDAVLLLHHQGPKAPKGSCPAISGIMDELKSVHHVPIIRDDHQLTRA